MATSSFNEKFTVKDEAALLRLNEVMSKTESPFDRIRPITDAEEARRAKLAKEWIAGWKSSH